MIQYDNSHAFGVLTRVTGSVLPDCLPVALVTFSLGLGLALLRKFGPEDAEKDLYVDNPFAIKTIALVVGILLAVRTNMALERWMDGIEEVQVMLSKWGDAFIALNGFFSGKICKSEEDRERILYFRARIAHWFSLMSCLAFATLRARHLHHLEELPIREMFPEEEAPTLRLQRTFTRRLSCESTEMVKRMFSDKSSKSFEEKDVEGFRSLDLHIFSAPTAEEATLLALASDKVNTVHLWIVQGTIQEVRAGTLDTPAPIVTRVFQEISNGMLGFNQAHKVAMVPFPFPFAQLVSLLLSILYIGLPFYIDMFTRNFIFTPLLSFLIPLCFCGLNHVSIELEEPFGTDWNDVDIEVRHEEFLLMLVDVLRQHTLAPTGNQAKLGAKILAGVVEGEPLVEPEVTKWLEKLERQKTSFAGSDRQSDSDRPSALSFKASVGSQASGDE